ncbi:hypothetical protein TNCV_392171 [Trichonephila clavipes]|nr:hypothetical protein TNCV_392171 [Trichonephila clavipes]
MKSLVYACPVDFDETLFVRIAVVACEIREMPGVFVNVRHSLRRRSFGQIKIQTVGMSNHRCLEDGMRLRIVGHPGVVMANKDRHLSITSRHNIDATVSQLEVGGATSDYHRNCSELQPTSMDEGLSDALKKTRCAGHIKRSDNDPCRDPPLQAISGALRRRNPNN